MNYKQMYPKSLGCGPEGIRLAKPKGVPPEGTVPPGKFSLQLRLVLQGFQSQALSEFRKS